MMTTEQLQAEADKRNSDLIAQSNGALLAFYWTARGGDLVHVARHNLTLEELDHIQARSSAEGKLMHVLAAIMEAESASIRRYRVKTAAGLPASERDRFQVRWNEFYARANELDKQFPGLIACLQAQDNFPNFVPGDGVNPTGFPVQR